MTAAEIMPHEVPDPAPAQAVLSVSGLKVAYPTPAGTVVAIDGLDLTIRQREVIGLVGDAGSGKSTAALALMGVVRPPGRILAGSIRFDGRDLLRCKEEELRRIRGRDIGIIVQNPRGSLNPMLRIGKQIGNVYKAHNQVSPLQARERAVDMLRMVGINDPDRRVKAFAHELSGGMAQRALIAMALSSEPRLLIADEPTSGLDVTIQAQFLDQMWETVQRTHSAILLISQDLGIIANYCDRVVVLHDRRIVEDAPVRDFFARPGHPYSQSILRLQRQAAGDQAERRGQRAAAAPESRETLVEVDRLTKHFPIRGSDKVVQAVDTVSFAIGRGETVGLVGESGSGKTTIGRCLLRLEEPTAGEIRYRGEPISGIAQHHLRRFRSKLQIVFQDPYDSLNPRWSIGRILREPLDLHTTLSAKAKRDRAHELLAMVGLDPNALDVRPRGLGAGTMQRLNIARALATDPEFIVLDEPTSVLAPSAVVGLIELLRKLQRDLRLSYLFISHDLTTVQYLCHRVAVMYLGQMVELGTVDQVFETPRHPYSKALLASHLFPDPTRRRVDRHERETLTGEIPSPVDLPRGCYLFGRCPHATETCADAAQVLDPQPDGRLVRCWRATAGEIGDAA